VIAAHLILTLYGQWAVNDPRGSESVDFVDLKFAPLGPILFGRRPDGEQPTREEPRRYYDTWPITRASGPHHLTAAAAAIFAAPDAS
jgi:hypothetical protein